MNQQVPTVQLIQVDLRTIQHHLGATCSNALGSSGSTAGSSGQGPNELKQEVIHLTMVVSDDDEFADDPH